MGRGTTTKEVPVATADEKTTNEQATPQEGHSKEKEAGKREKEPGRIFLDKAIRGQRQTVAG